MPVMTDGHPTTVAFAEDATVKLDEKTVTPPSIEGGGENDVTTMLNVEWRTRMPKKLKTLGEMSLTAAYDPAVYPEIVAMINVNQLITITFPDSSTVAFWGWIDTFEPGEISEGEQPEADLTVIASNLNSTLVETGPVYTPPPP
jgi:hypothetical protein